MKSKRDVVWGLLPMLLALTVVCVLSGRAFAQDAQPAEQPVAEPSEAQLSLNDDGVRAMIEGDFAGAVAQLERSIRLGEINVTYLNLGRAYQKMGRCAKARGALEKAKTAPAVADPPPSEVRAVADRYLAELAEDCTGDEQAPADDTRDDSPEDKDDAPLEIGAPAEADTAPNLLGWGATISGVALVGGGVAMHFLAESERAPVTDSNGVVNDVTQRQAADIEKTADSYDTIGLAMGIGGGVLAAVGTYLLLTDEAPEEAVSDDGTTVYIGRDSVGISWTQHF